MKIRLLISILLPVLGLLSCAEDLPAPQVLKTSENNLHFSGNGGEWVLTVNSNAEWLMEGANEWCRLSKNEGINTEQIVVSVRPNESGEIRSLRLRVTSSRQQAEVSILQDTAIGEYHYELPVIFHVIYANADDTMQNVKARTIAAMIERCNQQYQNSVNSVNMNLKLIPATHDPAGNALPVAGINRVLRSTSAYQDSEKFLLENNTKDADLLWNPNKYINVFVFTFTRKNELGRSNLPFTPRQSSLEGLQANNTYFTKLPTHPWGIVFNNSYIYTQNAYQTLAHELGHYLGLYHVFAESDCAKETDYCDDTESYNRKEYETWLGENTQSLTEQQKLQRTSCDGVAFTSRNIMDYEMSYFNQFTPDQFKRVRHVLENSPLIPGPKNIIVSKVAAEDEKPVVRTIE